MAIKWIVTDMDGTLLNSNDRITDESREFLIACQKKGIRLILASGRSYVRLLPYAEQLKMREYDGCLIEINGLALNRLRTGERKVFSQLYRADIEVLFPFLQNEQVELQGYEDEALYYWIPEQHMPYKLAERKEKGYPEHHPLAASAWSWVISDDFAHNYPKLVEIHSMEELPFSINKLNCMDNPEKISRVYQALTERFGGKYEFTRTSPRLIETAPGGVTKGRTLSRFMAEEGIGPDEVMVFGDGENDTAMFRQVKYSIAMGNAADYVKEYAFDVTGTNDEDGVAAALKKYNVIA